MCHRPLSCLTTNMSMRLADHVAAATGQQALSLPYARTASSAS
jgi:hypothetical protein